MAIARDIAVADRNAAVATHSRLMIASMRYGAHAESEYKKLVREHQELLRSMAINSDVADLRTLSSFVSEVGEDNTTGLQPPTDKTDGDDKTDQNMDQGQ